ncbi:MAG: bifunctional enoyl-CoA hydratase/phosphate acetyltransferase [Candidatus Coatesbacteria bacterium]|nr:bifunctional enoyl-CoA hydratase/phosphate acetyltransferase [Candidatus Coatesbacteria bacterium]
MYQQARELAAKTGPKRLTVADAADEHVLQAVHDAFEEGFIRGILTGSRDKILPLMEALGMREKNYQIVDTPDSNEAARQAVMLVSSGGADMVLKGKAQTSAVLRAVLDKAIGLRTKRILSHVGVYEVPTHPKLIIMSDPGMNIAPTLEEKIHIIDNAVIVANALGIENPKVAILSAADTVNPAMPRAVEAAVLSKMSQRGQIRKCIVDGPLTLDAAVTHEAGDLLGARSTVSGDADVLIVNSIEEGNLLSKSLSMFAHGGFAGLIVGAKSPVLIVSRADSRESKLDSIVLGILLSEHLKKVAQMPPALERILTTGIKFDS